MLKGKVRKEVSKEPRKWVDYIQDESEKKAVPILDGRFQADLPEWIGPPKKDIGGGGDQETELKWLGTQIWPIKNESSDTTTEEEEEEEEEDDDVGIIGKGRAEELCDCESRGSVECVRRHVNDERIKLQSELGSAFWEWNFDGMGEEVSNQWTLEEQQKFESIVKRKPLLSQGGKGFLKAAMAALPSHNTQSIISYYFNVYLPRRIAQETRRSDNKTADTDEEETEQATNSKTSRKKRQRIIS